jgi:hypothetical protein
MAYTNIIDNIDFVDGDEKQYIYDYIERLNEEGNGIHEHLNKPIELCNNSNPDEVLKFTIEYLEQLAQESYNSIKKYEKKYEKK